MLLNLETSEVQTNLLMRPALIAVHYQVSYNLESGTPDTGVNSHMF